MKEIREILETISGFGPEDRAVLATVVDLQGSGYRLPGARMLILPTGATIGTVSGGCLEADVLERAMKVLSSGRPEIFTYDTTGNEDSVFSMNMGCRGIIRILLEPVHPGSRLIECLRRAWVERETQFVATITSDGAFVGARAFLNASSGYNVDGLPSIFDGSDVIAEALRNFADSGASSAGREFDTLEDTIQVSFEKVRPPVHVLLFGAGADAIPLAGIMDGLGWQVTVFDHRPAYLTPGRFPVAKELVLLSPGKTSTALPYDNLTAAVIMTHNYGRDLEILPAIMESEVFYIGLLGPKSRTRQLMNEIGITDANSSEPIERLYAPIGLDIGGQTPEGIALAMAAEIQSVLATRCGGHLRDREGSIYDRH